MDGFNQSAFEIEILTYMNHVHKQLKYPPFKSKHTQGGHEITILRFRVDGCCEPILKMDDLSQDDITDLKQIGSYDKTVKPTIYEADGCYFHSCEHIIKQCFDVLQKCTVGTEQKKLVSEIQLLLQRRYDMQRKCRCLEEAGYYVYSMTECRWDDEIKNISFADIDNESMIKPILVRKFGMQADVVTDDIIIEELKKPSPITGEGLFGLIRCDLEVPQFDLDTGMWELAPIFINTTITQDGITDHQHMRLINVSNDPDKPVQFEKRMLVDCVNGLFSTELLQWYLKHGWLLRKPGFEPATSCSLWHMD